MRGVQSRSSPAEPAAEYWVLISLRLPAAVPGSRLNAKARALLAQTLERWLKQHGWQGVIAGPDGLPRSDAVNVSFRQDRSETALAFRTLCRDLGLQSTMKQFRVHPNRCERTTPPI